MRPRTLSVPLLALTLCLAACLPDGGRTDGPPVTYSASGTVRDGSEQPIAGVTIAFGDDLTAVTTDEHGAWEKTGLRGAVVVTPKHDDYVFTPATREVERAAADVDFTGARLRTLSGAVLDYDENGIEGVTIRIQTSSGTVETTTDEQGRWEQARVFGAVTVTPLEPAYDFTPETASLTENETTVDFEGELRACLSGSQSDPLDPCVITHLRQLQFVSGSTRGHFKLGSDIDASATRGWNDGAGFEPIGTQANPFMGTFDGAGHTITGLFIHRPATTYVGLFGYVSPYGGAITNVDLQEVDITGGTNTGGLAGLHGGSISDSSSSGTVTGASAVGGLVGRTTEEATITGGHSAGTVTASAGAAGGLVGYLYSGGTVAASRSEAVVTGSNRVGGLVGTNGGTIEGSHGSGGTSGSEYVGGLVGDNGGTIAGSSSSGDVSATRNHVGGLAGYNTGTVTGSRSSSAVTGQDWVGGLIGTSDGRVMTSFSTGAVTANSRAGGLVGLNRLDAFISDSYSLSPVTVTDAYAGGLVGFNRDASWAVNSFSAGAVTSIELPINPGGLIGYDHYGEGTFTASYWDLQASGRATSRGGEGKTTDELHQRATYGSWDFDTVWTIQEGVDYPDLRNNPR